MLTHKYGKYYKFDGKLLNSVADKLLKDNNTEKAIELIKQSITLYSNNQPLTQRLLLSIIQNDQKNYETERKKILEKAKEKNNNIEARLNNLGYKLIRFKNHEDAIKVFQLNTNLFPQSANAFDSLGEAYLLTDDKELAIANYKKSLAKR